ncbi:MAG: acetylxylan esterase [Bacilli bacterium]
MQNKVVSKEPKDFDSFWKRQKARLAKVPLKSKMVKVKPYNENYESFEVWIDCVGKLRAFLSYPKGAAEKSLPHRLYFQVMEYIQWVNWDGKSLVCG